MLDPKAETVGDVDVAYELYRKKPPTGLGWIAWNIQRAEASGRDPRYEDQIRFGGREVRLLLKARRATVIAGFLSLQPSRTKTKI